MSVAHFETGAGSGEQAAVRQASSNAATGGSNLGKAAALLLMRSPRRPSPNSWRYAGSARVGESPGWRKGRFGRPARCLRESEPEHQRWRRLISVKVAGV